MKNLRIIFSENEKRESYRITLAANTIGECRYRKINRGNAYNYKALWELFERIERYLNENYDLENDIYCPKYIDDNGNVKILWEKLINPEYGLGKRIKFS